MSVSSHASTASQTQPTSVISPALEQSALPPATVVSYSGRFVKARIDRNVPLQEIIAQLVHSTQLQVQEPPALFALRDAETDELLTPENLGRKLDGCSRLKLCSSPVLEAAETVEKLASRDDRLVKTAAHSLKAYVSEPTFVKEFLARGGLRELVGVVERSTGNTLAYSCTSLLSLMDVNEQWEGIDARLINRLCTIITDQSLSNVVRPATAILRRLVLADLTQTPDFGFQPVWTAIRDQPRCFETIVSRLGSAASGDALLVQASLSLVNALYKRAVEEEADDFLYEMDRLDVRAAVVHLVESSKSEDLAPHIIQFQDSTIAACYAERATPFVSTHSLHQALLEEVLLQLKAPGASRAEQLASIGISDPDTDFGNTGLLGVRALLRSARTGSQLMTEQSTRPRDKQCLLAIASNEALDAISDLFDFTTGIPSSTNVQPLLLAWHRVHALATRLFFRIWTDSGASNTVLTDFTRVATLVRSQIQLTVRDNGQTTVIDVERDFANADYRSVRDRLSKELAVEDDLLTKAPVRSLRARLYRESFDCVRQQRIRCLQEGAWFVNAAPTPRSNRPRTWRFYRLAANCKHLHWIETTTRQPVRGGLEDLPDRIDLSLVTDIIPHPTLNLTSPKSSVALKSAHRMSTAGSTQPLGFTLLSGETVLADMQATDANTYAEWIDGLSLLRPDGVLFTADTTALVQSLTELGVKVKLLDLSGEKIDIPSSVDVQGCPISTDFFFSTSS